MKRTFYHVTRMKNIKNIKKNGLNPRKSPWWPGRKLFLFGSKKWAKKWQKHRPVNTVMLKVKAEGKYAKYHRQFIPPHYSTTRKVYPKDIRIVEVRKRRKRR